MIEEVLKTVDDKFINDIKYCVGDNINEATLPAVCVAVVKRWHELFTATNDGNNHFYVFENAKPPLQKQMSFI